MVRLLIGVFVTLLGSACREQHTAALPTLAGYRLGAPRSSLPKDLPCMPDNTCEPADSVTLYFRGGPTIGMIEVGWIEQGHATSPLQFWQGRIRPWLTPQLGQADSVQLSMDGSELNASWHEGTADATWSGKLDIHEMPGRREELFIYVRIACMGTAAWCQAYYAR